MLRRVARGAIDGEVASDGGGLTISEVEGGELSLDGEPGQLSLSVATQGPGGDSRGRVDAGHADEGVAADDRVERELEGDS